MTTTYSDKSFLKLLLRWRGSVWKLVFKHYIIFLLMYFAINFSYRFAMNDHQQLVFERIVKYFDKWNRLIPIQFLIGFYVTSVFSRFWEQLNYVSWPDKFLIFVVGTIQGEDTETRLIRRTFSRWCNLLNVLVWKEISVKIKKRFPEDGHLVKAGLMTLEEQELYKKTTPTYGRWFVPVSWMVNLVSRCRAEGRISDFVQIKLLDELYAFRTGSAMLTVFDWVNVPLVYTQVVTLATYGYFMFCLFSRQSLKTSSNMADQEIDLYFPLFTTLEFIFYIGWMKVGEELRCPFGEGDDDFDMNFVLDRNIQVSTMLIEELARQKPKIEPDRWWDDIHPVLPHTKASYRVRDKIPDWRLHKYRVRTPDRELLEGTESDGGVALVRSRSLDQLTFNNQSSDDQEMASLSERF